MSVKANQVELAAALSGAHKQAECGSPPSPEIANDWVQQASTDPHLHPVALDILAHAHQHQSDHRAAQAAFSAAIHAYHKAGLPTEKANSHILLGTSLLLSEEPFRALEQWSLALALARDTKNLAQCARVYLAIGQVYIGFGEDKIALDYNLKALKMAKVLADDRLACETHLYIVNDYMRMNRFAQAMAELDCAERLLSEPNKVWSAEILFYRGAIHAKQGLYAQAKIELETAYELSLENQNLWGQTQALVSLGEVLLQLRAPSTEQVLLQGLALAQKIQLRALEERCNQALIDWYLAQQAHESAVVLLAAMSQSHPSKSIQISAPHQQRIKALENQSRILQLRRAVI